MALVGKIDTDLVGAFHLHTVGPDIASQFGIVHDNRTGADVLAAVGRIIFYPWEFTQVSLVTG